MSVDRQAQLATLPQVDALVRGEGLRSLVARHGLPPVVAAARAAVADARTAILEGAPPATAAQLEAAVRETLEGRDRRRVRRVINATGVILHTNLGRAPLSADARAAVADAAGYATVEYDLQAGSRGSRTGPVGELAAEVCHTPSATVVNNGAAALMLVLAALASDREVIVSRGELVEIGGSYRLPDVMAAAGARLVEVGTTNRTRIDDYRRAIGEDTALLLKVHRSNFRMVGFTEDTGIDELASLGRDHDVAVVHDLGTGLLRRTEGGPLADEPSVEASVANGSDLVVFSGDKLLGGPQAGIIAGRADLVEPCRRHPLARAVRVDKLQRAALEATLASHARSDRPLELPIEAMLHADPARLEERARWMVNELGDRARPLPTVAVVGGGSSPGTQLPSHGVALTTDDAEGLARALRDVDPPVIGRVRDGEVVLDLRTVPPSQDGDLVDLVLLARG